MRGSSTTTPKTSRHGLTSARQHLTRLTHRRPNSRTVVGALLVSTAALGTFLAVNEAGATQQQSLVVANRSVAVGERLDSSTLSTISVDRESALASHGFTTVEALSGSVALAPIGEGELIQRSAVLADNSRTPSREFSFPIDRDRALNGDLRAGERVDVLATYGSGSDATTTVLARDARVIRSTDAKSGSLGSSGKLIITLALPSADQLLDAAHAAQVASITVVRSTLAGDTTGSRSATTGPLARAAVTR